MCLAASVPLSVQEYSVGRLEHNVANGSAGACILAGLYEGVTGPG